MTNKFFMVFFAVIFLSSVTAAPSWIIYGTNSSFYEDQTPVFTYNFTNNVTGTDNASYVFQTNPPGGYPILSSLYGQKSLDFYYWITINASTGVLTINSTRDNETGEFNMSLDVVSQDLQSAGSRWFYFNITPVNDAPVFTNLENRSFNISSLFEYIIQASDEENNVPLVFNITFLNCSTAQWSNRNNTNCTLFTASQYSSNNTELNISFIPLRNDVGYYLINFSVTDNSTLGNKTTSQLVNFTIININSHPYFTYICDNEKNWNEDQNITCRINATDIDEINNLTFNSNYSWFLNNNFTIVNSTTNFNGSALVNFTSSDIHIGNWSINLSVRDTGDPARTNSTVFYFYIGNVNDSAFLHNIQNLSGFTGNSYSIPVNASDDDLLIPDKRIYNENLTIIARYINGSDTNWLTISYESINGNKTTASIQFTANSDLIGDNILNISVSDANNYSSSSQLVNISISGNNFPQWNSSMNLSYNSNESAEFYLNLSLYVFDPDNEQINFSYTNLSYFPLFSLTYNGIINFTPNDADIGFHDIIINISDGKNVNQTTINFTVYNLNDSPFIARPLDVDNATVDSNSNINTTEDNFTRITLNVHDEDFRIPVSQKNYYNESLTLNATIQGPNPALFSFAADSGFPLAGQNLSVYNAEFMPSKTDIGNYNITINVSDKSNFSMTISFNLTVFSINHNPVTNLTNQSSAINKYFYYRINATDAEDGNSATLNNSNFTFSYNFLEGIDLFNGTTFNSTTGEINISFNSTVFGKYHINITVNDSTQMQDFEDFWIFIYGHPNITYFSVQFNLIENTTSDLIFLANHSVLDNLTYHIYLDNILRYNISYYGNNTNLTWGFAPNFTDETYGGVKNITLEVYNLIYAELNTSQIWNITINHTNSPVSFSGAIENWQSTYNSAITINLSEYFSDLDYSDNHYNQSINFTVSSNFNSSSITSTVSEWILTLSSSSAVTETLNITSSDLENNISITNITSNNFQVQFTTPPTTPVTTSSSGGGGGGGIQYHSLKIISPGDIILSDKYNVEVNFAVKNNGNSAITGINLADIVKINDVQTENVKMSFSKSYIGTLATGQSETITLYINALAKDPIKYKATIYANATSPKISDWADFSIEIKEINESDAGKQIIFTEKLISENPECLELKEIVNEAKKYFEEGDYENSLAKANEAVEACKLAISLNEQIKYPRGKIPSIVYYSVFLTFILFIAGFVFYVYKRIKFSRAKISDY